MSEVLTAVIGGLVLVLVTFLGLWAPSRAASRASEQVADRVVGTTTDSNGHTVVQMIDEIRRTMEAMAKRAREHSALTTQVASRLGRMEEHVAWLMARHQGLWGDEHPPRSEVEAHHTEEEQP